MSTLMRSGCSNEAVRKEIMYEYSLMDQPSGGKEPMYQLCNQTTHHQECYSLTEIIDNSLEHKITYSPPNKVSEIYSEYTTDHSGGIAEESKFPRRIQTWLGVN